MRKQSLVACLLLVPLFACKKESPTPASTPAAAQPAAQAPAAPPAAAPGDDVKALLTEDKITRFATYQKEISAVTSEAVGAGVAAYQKGGGDQKKFEKAVAADDRTAKIAAASQAALEKSGLSQAEVSRLTSVLTPYYAKAYAMTEMFKGDDSKDKKPGSVEDVMAKVREEQKGKVEAMRKEFAAKYGEDALALVRKHEPEFFALNEKIMGAAMGAFMKKK